MSFLGDEKRGHFIKKKIEEKYRFVEKDGK